MERVRILEGESLGALSARVGVPGCMLLRANGLYSPAWLLPGREIVVPAQNACERGLAFPCPAQAVSLPAWPKGARRISGSVPEQAHDAARTSGLPTRLLLLARTQALCLPQDCKTVAVRYAEDWSGFARRVGRDEKTLMRINRYWGALLPGMRLAVPREGTEGCAR